jgi:putative endonuclease
MAQWFLYMVRCSNSALYTGITTDVDRRSAEHRSGNSKSAKYIRFSASVKLVYQVRLGSRSLASKAEYWVKKLPKVEKEAIVRGKFSRNRLLRFLEIEPPDPEIE